MTATEGDRERAGATHRAVEGSAGSARSARDQGRRTARILFVEDDEPLREAVAATLSGAGYSVATSADGRDFPRRLAAFGPDLVLLDVRLPGGPDGFELADCARRAGVPLVFLTAADALSDRLTGFERGAEDYVGKPFALAELLARLRAVLRRLGRAPDDHWVIGDLVIDGEARQVCRGGSEIAVTSTEFEVLAALARRPGRPLSKLQLLSLVWGFDGYDTNLVEVHISALRRKLERTGPRLIHTERGAGYVMRPPSDADGVQA